MERELVGCIEWPNGMGLTPCTAEYEEAVHTAQDARDAWDEVRDDRRHPDHAARYEAMCRADAVVTRLQAEGGHMGEPVRFDRPDPIIAFMGGGQISAADLRAALVETRGGRS